MEAVENKTEEETKEKGEREPMDDEQRALGACLRLLKKLETPEARERVSAYLAARFRVREEKPSLGEGW